MRTVYMDGKFIPEAEAKVSIYSLDVMQAAAAFEMTRSFNGKAFKLPEHLDRLQASCKLLSIPFDFDAVDVMELCREVTHRNIHGPGEEHRLLIVVSPGCAPMYKDLAGVIPHPFLYIADFPLRYTVQGFSRYFTEGVHCSMSEVYQVVPRSVPTQAKHRSRLHFHLAQMRAPEGTWPILRDDGGRVTEAPGANLMAVKDGKLFSFDRWALPGISRETAFELGQSLVESAHRITEWSDTPGKEGLLKASELWLTGTPFCMLPVVSLDGKPIGDGKPGPIFKQTLAKWSAMVGVDIQRQIEEWDGL